MKKVLVVTGGARGIGAATARLAAERGYAVCVNYVRNRAAAEELVAAIRKSGGTGIAVAADVAEEAEVLRLFETVDRELGPPGALVNCAGVLARETRLEEMDGERITRMLTVNVLGTMLCAREAVKRMSTRRSGAGGAIVNLSTALTRSGAPGMYLDYATSKGAVEVFTGGLAREVAAEGIRVNAVRPGIIDTDIHADGGNPDRIKAAAGLVPMRRHGEPLEVARAILWLMSEEASYTSGAILNVAGGN